MFNLHHIYTACVRYSRSRDGQSGKRSRNRRYATTQEWSWICLYSAALCTESVATLPPFGPKRDKSGLTRYPANESPRRTGLHWSISAKTSFYLPAFEISRSCRTASDFQPMRVLEEPVCIDLFRQNPVFFSLHLKYPVHVVPPLSSQCMYLRGWIG